VDTAHNNKHDSLSLGKVSTFVANKVLTPTMRCTTDKGEESVSWLGCFALALPPKETSHVQNFMLLMAADGEGNCMGI